MKRMLKKLLSVLLALSLLMSLFTMTAAASEANGWKEERAAIGAIRALLDNEDSLLSQYFTRGGGVLHSVDAHSGDEAFTIAPAVQAPLLPVQLPPVPVLSEPPVEVLPEVVPEEEQLPEETVDGAIDEPADDTTDGTTDDTTGDSTDNTTDDSTDGTTNDTTDNTTGDAAGEAAQGSAEGASESAASQVIEASSTQFTGEPGESVESSDPVESGDSGDPAEYNESLEPEAPVTVTLGDVAAEVADTLEGEGVSLRDAVWQISAAEGGFRILFGYLTAADSASVLALENGAWLCGALPVDGAGVLNAGEPGLLGQASFETKLRLWGEDGQEIPYETGALIISQEGTYRVSGCGSGANNIVLQADAAVILDNVTVEELGSGLSAVEIAPGVNAVIVVEGACVLTGGSGGSGILVPAGSTLDLSGDRLTATGSGTWGAGIGSYSKVAPGSGSITIHDLNELTATGGMYGKDTTNSNGAEGGPGIGGGTRCSEYLETGEISKVTIQNCGSVKAWGGSKAAGIGSGFWNACDIEITNSTVDALGGATAPAIGTARNTFDPNGNSGYGDIPSQVLSNIVIKDSSVTARGGYYGAGIGSGYNDKCMGDYARSAGEKMTSVSIEIRGSSYVEATGGTLGAGIGGGYKNFGDSVSISSGSTVYAYAGKSEGNGKKIPCGIGSGADGSSLFSDQDGSISISSGAEVYAFSYGYDALEPLASKWAVSRELADETSAAVFQCRFLVDDTFQENSKELYDGGIGVFSPSGRKEIRLSGAGESYTVAMPAGYTSLAATVSPGTYTVTVNGKVQSSLEGIAWSAESLNGTAYSQGEHADGTYASYAYTYQPDKADASIRYTFGEPSADFQVDNGINSFDAVASRPGVEPTRPAGFQVTYQWSGAVPAGVTKPAGTTVEEGAAYTPDTAFTASTILDGTYQGETGTFTFSGWDRTESFTVSEDVVIRGMWSFQATPSGGTDSGTDTDNSGRDDGSGDGGPVTVPDPQTPTADLPDLPEPQVPASQLPEEAANLPEPPVPLAEVPETGDGALVWLLAAAASLTALAALALSEQKR